MNPINELKDVFNDEFWNVGDQKYYIKMNSYGFPTSRMLPKYAYIIDHNLKNVWEEEYALYLQNPAAYQYPRVEEPEQPEQPEEPVEA